VQLSRAEKVDGSPAAVDSIEHGRPVLTRCEALPEANYGGVLVLPDPGDLHGSITDSLEVSQARTLTRASVPSGEPRAEQDGAHAPRVIDSRGHVSVKPRARSRRIRRRLPSRGDRAGPVADGAGTEQRQDHRCSEPGARSPPCPPARISASTSFPLVNVSIAGTDGSAGALEPPPVHVRLLMLTAHPDPHRRLIASQA
jgi:hypothetical protein